MRDSRTNGRRTEDSKVNGRDTGDSQVNGRRTGDSQERLPTWCADDGWCPMVATSAVLGRKWHPVIVHRLLKDDPLGFGTLEARIQGISGKVLSESLTDLQEKGLVERTVVNEKPVRVEYSLTEYGRGLSDAVSALERWGREYLREAPTPEESIV